MRAKRKELGLTQAQVARLLGTKQSNISAYERGVLEPGSVVEQRFAALLAVSVQTDTHKVHIPTLASQSVELRDLLDSPRFTESTTRDSLILRSLIDSNDRFASLHGLAEQQLFLMRPGPTGEHRADVAFAAWRYTSHARHNFPECRIGLEIRGYIWVKCGSWALTNASP